MNTIKIPVKVTTVEETFVEVELPAYTRKGSTFYRVQNSGLCYSVWSTENASVIGTISPPNAFEKGYELITKAEYDAQFEKALSILKGEQL